MDDARPLTLIPVAPTGERTDPCFVDGPDVHEFREMTFPTHPPSRRGKALRDLREHAELTMGDLARALGQRVEDVSSLEWGRLTLSDADWCAVFVALAEASRREHPPQVLDVDAMLAGDGGVAATDEDDTGGRDLFDDLAQRLGVRGVGDLLDDEHCADPWGDEEETTDG